MSEASANQAQDQLESKKDFKENPKDQHNYWAAEMNASHSAFGKYAKRANATVSRYLNDKASDKGFKLNLFNSNINTLQSMMFGKLPEIQFSRKNMDYEDDAARVAGMILSRMLNADIGKPNDQYSTTLRECLQDRLIPGLGSARVRYDFDETEVDVAEVLDQQTGQVMQPARKEMKITNERAPIEYVHWRDMRWSPARTWEEVRWEAFRTLMTRDKLVKRFGEKIGNLIPLDASMNTTEEKNNAESDDPKQDAFKRGEVWEIWDKENKKVIWYCAGHDEILDTKDDPLRLTGFFPSPRPMIANVTTTAFMPIPDYIIAQDLYLEIDKLETRISLITEAVKVVGVYDQSQEGVKRMMTEAVENDLIPVDNWAMFAERGGLQGAIDWLPIDQIANVLEKLVARRNDCKGLLYEINGISDIMRGAQAAGGAVSATERALEARFASVRVQSLQDEFAKYATDLIRLRAEVVAIHFQPESIVKQSNIEQLKADQENIGPAVELIKNQRDLIWRLQVKPESVAMVDYAQLKDERTAYITALATFLQSSAPLVEMEPKAVPILLEMLKWGLAGFKGSQEVEGILDQAIQMMQQSGGEKEGDDKPSPEEIKAQMEQQKAQHDEKMKQMDQQTQQQSQQFDQMMEQMQAQNRSNELQQETDSKLQVEAAQAELNMLEEEKETEEFIKREKARARLAPSTSDS